MWVGIGWMLVLMLVGGFLLFFYSEYLFFFLAFLELLILNLVFFYFFFFSPGEGVKGMIILVFGASEACVGFSLIILEGYEGVFSQKFFVY